MSAGDDVLAAASEEDVVVHVVDAVVGEGEGLCHRRLDCSTPCPREGEAKAEVGLRGEETVGTSNREKRTLEDPEQN